MTGSRLEEIPLRGIKKAHQNIIAILVPEIDEGDM
jgi:hypothetical protein